MKLKLTIVLYIFIFQGSAIFFWRGTIVASFLHFMVLFYKVIFNHTMSSKLPSKLYLFGTKVGEPSPPWLKWHVSGSSFEMNPLLYPDVKPTQLNPGIVIALCKLVTSCAQKTTYAYLNKSCFSKVYAIRSTTTCHLKQILVNTLQMRCIKLAAIISNRKTWYYPASQ